MTEGGKHEGQGVGLVFIPLLIFHKEKQFVSSTAHLHVLYELHSPYPPPN